MWLAIVNGIVGVFNLIPAAPLDGGRILGAGLWAAHHDRDRAMLGAARVGVLFGWALVLLGVWGFVADQSFGLWPALLGWFVVVSAQAEARFAAVRMTLRGISVADAMSPSTGLPGWLTVEAFVERFVDGSVPAFVVERWEGGVAGVVTLDALRMVAAADRGHMRVVELAVPVESLRTAQPTDDLATVWGKPAPSARLPHVVVLSHGKVVGIVSPHTIERRRAAAVSSWQLWPSTSSTSSTSPSTTGLAVTSCAVATRHRCGPSTTAGSGRSGGPTSSTSQWCACSTSAARPSRRQTGCRSGPPSATSRRLGASRRCLGSRRPLIAVS
jgi:hypothetical protein